MSAFTPYHRVKDSRQKPKVGSSEISNNNFHFPINLVVNLPKQNKMLYDVNYFDRDEPKKPEQKNKNEQFLIKNILREETVPKKLTAQEQAARFAEHASQVEALVSNLGKTVHGHHCIYCGKIYSRKYGLKIHIRHRQKGGSKQVKFSENADCFYCTDYVKDNRTHTGYKPLKCKICSRRFGDPSNLNKHVRLHAEGSTPYRCEHCQKVLVRRRDLERHISARHSLQSASNH